MQLSYRSPKTEVRDSPIHGKGLYATDRIRAGEIVAVKGGYIVERDTRSELEKELGSAEVQIAGQLFIAPVQPSHREGSMVYLNHSCEPNCAIAGQIVFVAMKKIAPGEELTHDWATTDDLDYEIKCNFGSADCRGIITGKDWMRPELQKKYAGWFCWFLERKIKNLASGKPSG